jgi:hypothetical protein
MTKAKAKDIIDLLRRTYPDIAELMGTIAEEGLGNHSGSAAWYGFDRLAAIQEVCEDAIRKLESLRSKNAEHS